MNHTLVIIGAGGNGKVLADIAQLNGYKKIIFLDDGKAGGYCGTYCVLGPVKDAGNYPDADFIVSIGNSAIREKFQCELIQQGLHVTILIHPASVVAKDTVIGPGCAIMAGAVVNPGAVLGAGVIVNTCSSVDHDCRIGDYAHISVGAHVAGTVNIGEHTWIGAGATIGNNLNITSNCMIGAGAVVVRDIIESGTYIGVPARKK